MDHRTPDSQNPDIKIYQYIMFPSHGAVGNSPLFICENKQTNCIQNMLYYATKGMSSIF